MTGQFSHPLARDARAWRSFNLEGVERNILVVITTLALEKDHPNYKSDKVARLADAARAWIARTAQADEFVLINRPRDWD